MKVSTSNTFSKDSENLLNFRQINEDNFIEVQDNIFLKIDTYFASLEKVHMLFKLTNKSKEWNLYINIFLENNI